jgi:hypothetical protein
MRFRFSRPIDVRRQSQRRLLALAAIVAAGLFAVQLYRSSLQSVAEREQDSALSPASYEIAAPNEPRRLSTLETENARGSAADPRIDKTVLESVRDDTLGIRREEAEAFFAVLDHVRRVSPSELEQSARQGVLHANLMIDSETFRGELVTIVGEMQRCSEFSVTPNDYGIDRLYEAWVIPSDSGGKPQRVVAWNLGDGVSLTDRQPAPVRMAGYFFKREGYDTSAGLRIAPTLLAQTIALDPTAPAPIAATGMSPGLLGAAVAVGLILTVTLFAFAWSDRSQPRLRGSLPTLSANALAAIEKVDRRSVSEQLRELSERDRFGASAAR